MPDSSILLVFGPQAPSFKAEDIQKLRSVSGQDKHTSWISKIVAELPDLWGAFEEKFPEYSITEGKRKLQDLHQWIVAGNIPNDVPQLPNLVLSPLVVMSQIVELLSNRYQEPTTVDTGPSDARYFLARTKATVGFCTGIFGALAFSLSNSEDELHDYISRVIRISMLVGGVVDSQEHRSPLGGWRALSVAWKTAEIGEEMGKVLKEYPEAYVSVIYDDQRVTVTAPASSIMALQQRFRAVGGTTFDIGIRGSFHHPSYQNTVDVLTQYCDEHPVKLALPAMSSLIRPVLFNSQSTADLQSPVSLHKRALQAILVERSPWIQTLRHARDMWLSDDDCSVLPLGSERCIPHSMIASLGSRIVAKSLRNEADLSSEDNLTAAPAQNNGLHPRKPDDIAIIGMAVKVAGADDTGDFWKLLSEAKSQHKEVPRERFNFDSNSWREQDPTRKWFANLVNNYDTFDHRFFKKSPREIASTDPQHRQMLQAAYQAVEQSGYFGRDPKDRDQSVGCFIGNCTGDYEANISCHQPNAFTAVGNLRSFTAGKISHYFGWVGPTRRWRGGTNMITHPGWFQNLAAASFLSPTGQCKPFDAGADGYCRGEGVAAVYLKKMSAAIADGDQVFGAISGTAVTQNQNCTPIFVPSAPSLADLFEKVMGQAQVVADQIGYVEAHGTGTPVGDPAEYQSILSVLAGARRTKQVSLGSVKGLVGHTEGASGAISLLKSLLMLHHNEIPAQPSFEKLSPGIPASPDDKLFIATNSVPWAANDGQARSVLINNYGASGSNASMVVTESPTAATALRSQHSLQLMDAADCPLRLIAADDASLRRYCARLERFLQQPSNTQTQYSLADLSFNLSRQCNPSLERHMAISCRSLTELKSRLKDPPQPYAPPPPRPVILSFGGQVSTHVGVDRAVYLASRIFRVHLDECDSLCRALGASSIFPDIFSRDAVGKNDVAHLQTMLFSAQYACAQSWIDCGTQPVAVVGHSFGELTALCISGALGLREALRMIIGRATAIRDHWADEKGAMLAVQGNKTDVHNILADAARRDRLAGEQEAHSCTIACFNGPTSFTIAGSRASIDRLTKVIASNPRYSSLVRYKKLNVTNAFHSALVQDLEQHLHEVGQRLSFTRPIIHLELATESGQSLNRALGPSYVANHMRNPVYFQQAVHRLSEQYPSAIWLEAGFNSTITDMANRALGAPKASHFQGVNIGNGNGLQQLTNISIRLWKEGLSQLVHWTHHRHQTYDYATLLLPPYQFEQSRHWTELKSLPSPQGSSLSASIATQGAAGPPKGLWSFVKWRDDHQRKARFSINTESEEYKSLVAGHVIAQTVPICPATVELDIVIEAVLRVRPGGAEGLQPQVQGMSNQAAICHNPTRCVFLDIEATDKERHLWDWKFTSQDRATGAQSTLHATGKVVLITPTDEAAVLEFSLLERLMTHQDCLDLLDKPGMADDVIQSRTIYRTFSPVVDYGESFRGLRKLVGRSNRSAGRLTMKASNDSWLDAHLGDCFCQTAGIWVNCVNENCDPGDMFIAIGIEKWIRSPKETSRSTTGSWHVLANHHTVSRQSVLTDVFVYEPTSGDLVEVILGIRYHKVAKTSMSKLLLKLSSSESTTKLPKLRDFETTTTPDPKGVPPSESAFNEPEVQGNTEARQNQPANGAGASSVANKIRALLAEMSGIEEEDIRDDSQLVDMGIDSLMGMEVARELSCLFDTSFSIEDFLDVTDFRGLVNCVRGMLGPATSDGDSMDESQRRSVFPTGGGSGEQSTTPSSDGESEDQRQEKTPLTEASNELSISVGMFRDAFEECKQATGTYLANWACAGYASTVLPEMDRLCVALILEAFEQMGCALGAAKSGDQLQRISCTSSQQYLTNYLYSILDKSAGLVEQVGGASGMVRRTSVTAPSDPSQTIVDELLRRYPAQHCAIKLTYFTGTKLVQILEGHCDGIKLIFGSQEGRELVAALYGDFFLNQVANAQMGDMLRGIAAKLLPHALKSAAPLRIMEVGAGTGGTTQQLVKVLAELGIPVVYTFTDLAASFVAAARKRFKHYPFMEFRTHDIEKPLHGDLLGTQHVIIASNAIHATRSLVNSTKHLRQGLRPDGGFLMMMEMTHPMYWVDLIFGLFEGWWLFEDGREHAVADTSVWETALHGAGYSAVDWTDGKSPEAKLERVIVAFSSEASVAPAYASALGSPESPRYEYLNSPISDEPPREPMASDLVSRKIAVDDYVRRCSQGFSAPQQRPIMDEVPDDSRQSTSVCVAVTGATGSLGAHIVAHLAGLGHVSRVICLNRRSTTASAEFRQDQAFRTRGLCLEASSRAKVRVLDADTRAEALGLSVADYQDLAGSVTHIIHNAWPMTSKRALSGLDAQFRVMRNMVDLAHAAASRPGRREDERITFQFVSSIAIVGHHPYKTGKAAAPEERMTIDSVLPNGYGDAKFVCERILDETLHKHPAFFRPMSVRPGQIAGSSVSGYWNPQEHLPFLIKSSQTLKAIPKFDGELSWTPVNDVAGTLCDLVLSPGATHPIYHIDNPVRQLWKEMVPVLAQFLEVDRAIPLQEWLGQVRSFTGKPADNPAGQLVDFLEDNFVRMSCGGLLLDTSKACKDSPTLAAVGPISTDVVQRYIQSWKKRGFLR
ncbi:protein required for conidial pigmentation [Apiospora saccharicola]